MRFLSSFSFSSSSSTPSTSPQSLPDLNRKAPEAKLSIPSHFYQVYPPLSTPTSSTIPFPLLTNPSTPSSAFPSTDHYTSLPRVKESKNIEYTQSVIQDCFNLLSIYLPSLVSLPSSPTPPSTPPLTPTQTSSASNADPPPSRLKLKSRSVASSSTSSVSPSYSSLPLEELRLLVQNILRVFKTLKTTIEAQQTHYVEGENVKNVIFSEFETLSARLFEQANNYVREERILRHQLNEKLTLSIKKEKEACQLVETLQKELNALKKTISLMDTSSSSFLYKSTSTSTSFLKSKFTFPFFSLHSPQTPLLSETTFDLPLDLPLPSISVSISKEFIDFIKQLCNPTLAVMVKEKRLFQTKFMKKLKQECELSLPLDHFTANQKSSFVDGIFRGQVTLHPIHWAQPTLFTLCPLNDVTSCSWTCYFCHTLISCSTFSSSTASTPTRMTSRKKSAFRILFNTSPTTFSSSPSCLSSTLLSYPSPSFPPPEPDVWKDERLACSDCHTQCLMVCQIGWYLQMQLHSAPSISWSISSSPSKSNQEVKENEDENENEPSVRKKEKVKMDLSLPLVQNSFNASIDTSTEDWIPSDTLLQQCWKEISELRYQMFLAKLGYH
ncbi:hypothetical protein HMI54_006103 [Coelomomyces lativittatus]|nr:hypothetical protein HMI56_002601 [Coelomomyces lativittatus]KAJ1505288.1 hypothetical protein HMI54_006103 [Coelomomyces lativittatus]